MPIIDKDGNVGYFAWESREEFTWFGINRSQYKMTNLIELAKQIRFDNASKGFDPTEGGIERYLLLTVSEICEAQNELRDGHGPTEIYYSDSDLSLKPKPEGFPVEIADAIIRILDIQAKLELDIEMMDTDYNWDLGQTEEELLKVVHLVSRNDMSMRFKLNLALTRLFHISHDLGIDVMKVINEKLEYNRTRPAKHGRKF